ncbi:MAG TPA: tetratricopeptide repeat protein [Caldimonas sp.]|nr:tetratricopeptide repeat protein [Caldimonas sp.]
MAGAERTAERALALCRQGRFAEAKAMLEPLARVDRPDARVLALLGAICLQLGDIAAGSGQLAAALAFYERSIAVRPDHFQAHYNRGVVLYQSGQGAAAAASYEKALALAPDLAAAHSALGVVQSDAGADDAALRSHDRAVALAPSNPELHNNRGLALDRAHRHDDAVRAFDAAIALAPGFGAAWANRGVALHQLGRFGDALASADAALAIDPGDAEAWSNRGLALHDLHRDGEALVALERATMLAPALANAWANLGATLNRLKRHEEALAAYDRALAVDADLAEARGDRLHTAMLLCDWRGLDDEIARIGAAVDAGAAVVHPFTLLPTAAPASLQKRCAERYVAAHWSIGPAHSATADGSASATPGGAASATADGAATAMVGGAAGHRIRLGYFSADFHQHATMDLIAELFERHDRARFELHAFSFGPSADDPMRARAIAAFDRFHEVGAIGDGEIAALARSVAIDIAIDLKGFTQDARPGIFAARAAPVQASYLGYPGTMGAGFIDYLIADEVVVPAAARADHTEQVAWVPRCYQANAAWHPVAPPRLGRHDVGLPDDGFVFCSFNNSYKIDADVFAVWMRLLQRVPGSALWLIEANAGAIGNLRREAADRGVAAERIVFAPRTNRADHLSRHRLADLFVDTLHYGAHTTASDALRAGLPVLTRLGPTFASRVAASLVRSVGLDELVTASVAAYEATALALATDPARLQSIRNRLAATLPTAALFDVNGFARDLEQLYAAMHARRRAGLPPVHLDATRGGAA